MSQLTVRGSIFEADLGPHGRVVIGDENASYFRPHIRLDRWNEEGSLAFGLETTERILPSFDGQKVMWTNGDEQHVFSILPAGDGMEYGGVEYELHLGSPPKTSTISFPMSVVGLALFAQPPLTPFERARGNFRPDNIVGSIAAYHATRGVLHSEAGAADKYKTGKAFHLHRPLAIDALGNRHWLAWQQKATELAIVVDAWLLDATYPVLIDPTIGYTTLGASYDNTDNYALANPVSTASSGDANPGTAYYGGFTASGTLPVYVCPYVWNAAGPAGQARIGNGSSAITLTTVSGFRSAAITWTNIVASTNYFLVGWSNSAGVRTHYDAGLTIWFKGSPGDTPSDPFPSPTDGTTDQRNSLYVDYAAAGGGDPEGSLIHGKLLRGGLLIGGVLR